MVFETTTIKLLPDQFEEFTDVGGTHAGTLCEKQSVGCGDFGGSFFKDPTVTGAKVCAWKTGVTDKNNNKVNGWFWKGVGQCGATTTPATFPATAQYCTSDTDCNASSTFNKCIDADKNNQPCYPDYLQNGSEYGLWSYGDTNKYQNFVGECPTTQDACTEFIDHADVDVLGNSVSYWFIKNNKLSEDNCAGQVSQKAGCALFDDTSVLTKLYNTAASYAESNKYAFDKNQSDLSALSKVKPVTTGSKDANVIIKVKRDRECAEWLQCASSNTVWDQVNSQWKKICNRFDRCNALPDSSGNDSQTNCGNFIKGQNLTYSNNILTTKLYVNRKVAWSNHDFDGYSILNLYPLEELEQFNFNTSSDPNNSEWHLAKPIKCGTGTNCDSKAVGQYFCKNNGADCGENNSGTCVSHSCLKDLNGGKDLVNKAPIKTCRAYPEKDSPFPKLKYNDPVYNGINQCATDNPSLDCDCAYTKALYGNNSITKYYSYTNSITGDTICSGGVSNGKACGADASSTASIDCQKNGGVCEARSKSDKFLGWPGVCVERDFSRTLNGDSNNHPCLTWLPLDQLQGVQDINNQYESAGLIDKIPDNTSYCIGSETYKTIGNVGTCDPNNGTDLSCYNPACESTAKTICDKFGYDVITPNNTENPDKPFCGGDNPYSGSCHRDAPHKNWCNVQCKPKPNSQKWLQPQDSILGGTSPTPACQVMVKIDKLNDRLFTNNFWKGDPIAIGHNYSKSSPNLPFARVFPDSNDYFNKSLLQLLYCKLADGTFGFPNAQGGCNIGTPTGGPDGQINMTYGDWPFNLTNSTAQCNSNLDCVTENNCKFAFTTVPPPTGQVCNYS
ncbi:MAG: hypothetical protein ACD_72C00446G0001, partial [uncultured bacterium]